MVADVGWLDTLRLVAREIDWRALRISRGVCPLCAGRLFVRISHDLLGTRCLACKASPISMAIGAVALDRLPRLGDLSVCELSSRGPFVEFLRHAVAGGGGVLNCSEYFDGVEPGSTVHGVQCQDVARLTYPDASFDVCTSTEVFEHVPDDRRGFSELARVLRPGGRVLLTVPLSDSEVTVERAVLCDHGRIEHLQPPTYHDDRIRGSARVLVYRDYGRDITARLEAAGFTEAEIVEVPDPSGGSAVARVVTARKA